ncbi:MULTISPECIES: hypothetical protein [Cyanophyceae]|nr:hypothetical protein [Trichocoleus sp. FACHB-40]MBD2004685.1 hypothetical protein [Trichocoleus sp. FACHB-40]
MQIHPIVLSRQPLADAQRVSSKKDKLCLSGWRIKAIAFKLRPAIPISNK